MRAIRHRAQLDPKSNLKNLLLCNLTVGGASTFGFYIWFMKLMWKSAPRGANGKASVEHKGCASLVAIGASLCAAWLALVAPAVAARDGAGTGGASETGGKAIRTPPTTIPRHRAKVEQQQLSAATVAASAAGTDSASASNEVSQANDPGSWRTQPKRQLKPRPGR